MPETPITDDYEEDTYTFVDDMVSGEISISKPRSQYSIFDSPQLIDSSNSPFITKDVRSPEQKKIKLGETLEKGASFGTVEAVKTTSELFMPVSGEILEFNKELDESEGDNPTLINTDPYGEGWVIKVKVSDVGELDGLMDAAAYKELVSV